MIFGMTELEERLRAEDAATVKVEALRQLAGMRDRLEAARGDGLSPDDFARSERLVIALAAARAILAPFPETKEI